LAALLVVAGLLALALMPAMAARGHLLEARKQMEAGRVALLAGQPKRAEDRFRAAEAAFINAQAQAGNPLLRLTGYLPLGGRTPDAVSVMSDAGSDVATAGAELAGSLGSLPDGLATLGPRNGRIPIRPLDELASGMERAWVLTRDARAKLEASPSSWLIGPVGEARRTFAEELAALETRLHAASRIVDRLPRFLGAAGTRRYFLGASNPAELRGSGGFIGAYAILTADRGKITISEFRPTQILPNAAEEELPPPSEDYGLRYPAAHGFWPNINVTPDFPSAAQAIENLYAYTKARNLDGVIVADPMALRALMTVSGDVEVPELESTLTADNVVAVLSNEAYAKLTDSASRKIVLGDAAKAVLERFLQGGGGERELAGAARALADAVAGGHLLVHSTDPELQRGLELSGAAGKLLPARGDYLAVAVNNGGGNKLDYYAERTLTYRVRLGADGMARSEVLVEIDNQAPRKGQPSYVIGPFPEASRAGENVSLVSVFLPPSARVSEADIDGESFDPGLAGELGHAVTDAQVRIPSGGTRTLRLSTGASGTWEGFVGGGVYSLTFQGQTTVKPTRLVIDVQVPDGTRIVRASPGMSTTERRAVWRGPAPRLLELEVEFQKPALPRAWDALTSFFSKRVVSF
jgi:hypothetical protein